MHVLINSYTTYEAMSTYFVHTCLCGWRHIQQLSSLCPIDYCFHHQKSALPSTLHNVRFIGFLKYFNGNQNSSFCCLHLCCFCCRTSMLKGGVVQKQCRRHRQMMKAGLQFCRFDKEEILEDTRVDPLTFGISPIQLTTIGCALSI